MEHLLGDAFSVLAVGMITVFFILALVVLVGNLIIRTTNKFLPEIIEKPAKGTVNSSSGTIAAIVAAVDTVTKGKGKVSNIKKI